MKDFEQDVNEVLDADSIEDEFKNIDNVWFTFFFISE